MRLVINIIDDKVKLDLFDRKRVIDSLNWKEDNSMSRMLLEKIDKLLHRNRISLDKISDYKIISEVPKKYTSYRIAEITFKSLMMEK